MTKTKSASPHILKTTLKIVTNPLKKSQIPTNKHTSCQGTRVMLFLEAGPPPAPVRCFNGPQPLFNDTRRMCQNAALKNRTHLFRGGLTPRLTKLETHLMASLMNLLFRLFYIQNF